MIRMRKSKLTGKLSVLYLSIGSIYALVAAGLFYVIWTFGETLIAGIPVQLLIITLVFPLILAGLVFYLSRKLDALSWLEDE